MLILRWDKTAVLYIQVEVREGRIDQLCRSRAFQGFLLPHMQSSADDQTDSDFAFQILCDAVKSSPAEVIEKSNDDEHSSRVL